ncbi:MAG: triose-phosphate isomerase [Woeseiaceae bacterium]|nr:triose-phosphate isomerase [Woeseiaceae bacterium]NIP20213.1 triose-phosphate isomerase [Woeseiaceae bacterium]NIS89009.1 triose-phosphate isomerase [Woeseiaceae bacterium]
MRNTLIAGNWKMNGATSANDELVSGIIAGAPAAENVELLICPPFPYLAAMVAATAGSKVAVGAQNVSEHAGGAFTGEVAASMLVDLGCEYVIVGHSERRTLYGESSRDVAAKFASALDAGLRPILCVGETLEERQGEQTETVIDEQLDAVIDAVGIEAFGNAVIAYEPVWAIGTGMTATPEQAQEVHAHIRARLAGHDPVVAESLQILYGGSMKGENAAGLLAMTDIDGGLIGGASLKAADFLAIAEAAAQG